MTSYKCYGCGITLQTEDKTKLGFVPKVKDEEITYCQRCFRLKNYGEFKSSYISEEEFKATIKTIKKVDALVVYITDIFDFEGSLVDNMNQMIGNNKVILVANKEDILPKAVKRNKLRHRIEYAAAQNGIKNIIETIVTSSNRNENIDKLIKLIVKNSKGKNVYFVGATNVGKSTLVNKLIQTLSNTKDEIITTSRFPGTTLDTVEIELEDGQKLIDTPGVINNHQLAHYVDENTLVKLLPRHEVRQRVYQLGAGQTVFIEKLAALSVIASEESGTLFFFSNELKLHRTKTEKKDSIWKNDGVLDYTISEGYFETKKIKVNVESDIVISGLGWIRVKPGSYEIEIPAGVKVFTREALI